MGGTCVNGWQTGIWVVDGYMDGLRNAEELLGLGLCDRSKMGIKVVSNFIGKLRGTFL